MAPPRIILASASPRRVELLRSLAIDFDVVPSRAEELHDPALEVAELCRVNAERKAEDVARDHPDRIVLGADTLVALAPEIFGKPRDSDEAFLMLAKLAGKTHAVVTGVCLSHRAADRREIFTEQTLVTFKTLAPETIRAYLAAVPVLDKAGAYGIQDRGEMLVERIEGSITNVIGLPTEKVAEALRRWEVLP